MASFRTEIRIRSSQCGQSGLLQTSRYFELLNRVVEDWFDRGLSLSFADLHLRRKIGIPAGRLTFRLHAPVALDDRLRLHLTVTRVGNRTIDLRITGDCDGAPRFEADVALVMVDLSAAVLKSCAIPPPLRAKLEVFGVPDR